MNIKQSLKKGSTAVSRLYKDGCLSLASIGSNAAFSSLDDFASINKYWKYKISEDSEIVFLLDDAVKDYAYLTTDNKWYAKNNNSVYEEYGIYETVDDLSSATYYKGKLIILSTDNHEYKWNGTEWVDLGEFVSINNYAIYKATCRFNTKTFFNNNYHVEIDYFINGSYSSGLTVLLGKTGVATEGPLEFTFYNDGFYLDSHYPTSTTSPTCNSGDYSKRIGPTTSASYIKKDGTKQTVRLGVTTIAFYNYGSSTALYSTGTETTNSWCTTSEYTMRMWVDGAGSVPVNVFGFRVYDNNNNLIHNYVYRSKTGSLTYDDIYAYDKVTGLSLENIVTTAPSVSVATQDGTYPEEYEKRETPSSSITETTYRNFLKDNYYNGQKVSVYKDYYEIANDAFQPDYSKLPFGIQAYDGDVDVNFTINYNTKYSLPTLYYSYDAKTWTKWNDIINSPITVTNGKTLYLYGPTTNCFTNSDTVSRVSGNQNVRFNFSTSNDGKVNLVGQFSSLLNPNWTTSIKCPANKGLSSEYLGRFYLLFNGSSLIYDAKNLHINFSDLTGSSNKDYNLAFFLTFANCTNLRRGATFDNAIICTEQKTFRSMYLNCPSLEEAEIPNVTTYTTDNMMYCFKVCPSLHKLIYRSSINLNYTDFITSAPSTGTFYNLNNATYTTGTTGIPEGWTIKNA